MPASTQDLLQAFDPTGYDNITGAQLLQYITGASPFTDKGLIVATSDDGGGNPDVPDASTETKWQNYIWLRISATATIPYIWNPNAASDAVLLQWQTIAQASIGIGTIVNAMIADNTIQDVKINNLSYSKLTGAPSGLPPSGAASGDLTGTYPSPSVASLAITTAKIAAGAVQTTNIADVNVTLGKLAAVSGSAKDMARVNGGATGMEAFTPPSVFTSGVVVTTANALKVPQVATAGAGDTGTWQMVAATTLGRILQSKVALFTTLATSSGSVSTAATPNYNATGMTAYASTTFTPISASSTIIVEAAINLSAASGIYLFAGLYLATGATQPIAFNAMHPHNGASNGLFQCVVRGTVASPGISLQTLYIAFGASSSSCFINSIDGSTSLFGGIPSSIRITEYL